MAKQTSHTFCRPIYFINFAHCNK